MSELCSKCRNCVWDGKAPLLFCMVEHTYRKPADECPTFEQKSEPDHPADTEDAVVFHDFSFSGIIACEEPSTAAAVVFQMLEESPTLRKLFRRMSTRRIVVPAGKLKEATNDGEGIDG